MLNSFEEMVLKCADPTARSHIVEAIKCYESGAYRAAIVSAYVATSFDLIQKLRALAASGDAEAKTRIHELENYQAKQAAGDRAGVQGLVDFERSLISLFKDKFEFFGVNEFEDMSRLQHDRNRCAHPTFQISADPYVPPAELARLHLRSALTHVLMQEPKQGKAALSDLQAVVLSSYFPSAVEAASERLAGSAIAHGREGLIKAFIDALLFGYATADGPYHNKVSAVIAACATAALHPQTALPRITQNTNKLLRLTEESAIRMGSAMALRIPEVGEKIDPAGRVVLTAWIKNPAGSAKANVLVRALSISWLAPAGRANIAKLTSTDLKNLTGNMASEVLDRVAQLMATAGSWAAANVIADDIAIRAAGSMTQEQVETVIAAAANGSADLEGSDGFNRFLLAAAESDRVSPSALDSFLQMHGLRLLGERANL